MPKTIRFAGPPFDTAGRFKTVNVALSTDPALPAFIQDRTGRNDNTFPTFQGSLSGFDPALKTILLDSISTYGAGASIIADLASGIYAGLLSSQLVCTRTGTSTAPDANGNIFSFPANTPRITNLGMLSEESRTNLLLQSGNFSLTPPYTTTNAVYDVGPSIVAPDGNMVGKVADSNTANAQHVLSHSTAFTVSANQNYTLSGYFKAAEYNTVRFLMADTTFATTFGVNITLDGAGSVTSVTSGTGVVTSSSIILLGNGWYKVTVTGIIDATSTVAKAAMYLKNAATYVGVPGSGAYGWGFQCELGLWATSYIPTGAAAVTRGSEAVSINPVSFGSAYSGYVVYTPQAALAAPASQTFFSFDDGTVNNRVSIFRTTGTGVLSTTNIVAGVGQAAPTSAAVLQPGQPHRFAFSFISGAQALALDGSLQTPSAAALITAPNQIHFVRSDGANTTQAGGLILRLAIWPTIALTNAQLQSVTSV